MAYWDISTAVYSGKSLYVGDLSTYGRSIRFKPDGLIMYLVDDTYNTIYQYTLSIAWEIFSAVYSGKCLAVGRQDDQPQDLSFNSDGSIMYMLGEETLTIFQYNSIVKKDTPWDISSYKYNRITLDISDTDREPFSLFFNPDGTKFYTLGTYYRGIFQYNLSVPWDITSGLFSGIFFYTGDQDLQPRIMSFSPDGKNLYIPGSITDTVYQYTLSIPWDLSTVVYSNKYLYIGDLISTPYGISFSINGSKMFILARGPNIVYQYTLPEIPPPPPKKEASRTGIYSFNTLS
ncbi:hypothetical protein ES705_48252 [subsurface metagenome]